MKQSEIILNTVKTILAETDNPSKEDLDLALKTAVEQHNKNAAVDFEGFTPAQMHQIINAPFASPSNIHISRNLSEDFLFNNSPFYQLAKTILQNIQKTGKIKLTQKGNLNVKFLRDLYELKILPDEIIENGYTNLNKQDNWIGINAVMSGIKFAGVTKKVKGTLVLTLKGKKLLKDTGSDLFYTLLESYSTKFNWAFFDLFYSEHCGQLGFLFSLWLLKKYGHCVRPVNFYA